MLILRLGEQAQSGELWFGVCIPISLYLDHLEEHIFGLGACLAFYPHCAHPTQVTRASVPPLPESAPLSLLLSLFLVSARLWFASGVHNVGHEDTGLKDFRTVIPSPIN